jgi:predicted nucleotidyltransferase
MCALGSPWRRKGSDIDILVEFGEGKAALDNFMDFAYLLERSLGKDVDLLTLEGVNIVSGKSHTIYGWDESER